MECLGVKKGWFTKCDDEHTCRFNSPMDDGVQFFAGAFERLRMDEGG